MCDCRLGVKPSLKIYGDSLPGAELPLRKRVARVNAVVAAEVPVTRVDDRDPVLAHQRGTSGLLVVSDVVRHDRTAILLRTRKDMIVADPGVAARVRRLADRDHVEVALERDRRRPHLVQEQLHAADWAAGVGGWESKTCRSRSAACSFIQMRSSMSSG